MAKSLHDILQEIKTAVTSNSTLSAHYGLAPNLTYDQQFSPVSLESAWIGVIGGAHHSLEQIFEIHFNDVKTALNKQKLGGLPWYVQKAKEFRYGQQLIAETDKYDNTGLTQQQILAMQVVKHAAAVEGVYNTQNSILRIKVAGENSGELAPLPLAQLIALQAYFNEIKYAGVRLLCSTGKPDDLIGNIRIYYNPMLLDSNGMLLSNGTYPIQQAINNYLRNLPFNGLFSIMDFTNAIEQAQGVKIVQVFELKSRFGADPFQEINDILTPDAGYMKAYSYTQQAGNEFINIEYLPAST